MISIKNYAIVTAAYWGFTLTDGALRMLVLLHFHQLGFTPFELASLFLLYEFVGVVTNLLGGWIATRLGLRFTLFSGLILQISALTMLVQLDPAWGREMSVLYVLLSQGLSGIAKDLTKMSAKSAIKVLVPDGKNSSLFKWVAALTGSKNTLKGIGFFLGGALLASVGFNNALLLMAAGLSLIVLVLFILLKGEIGKISARLPFREILSKNRNINLISMARFFLFGGRDVWFVVGIPLYLGEVLGWSSVEIGSFMAAWVIAYGGVQMIAPLIIRKSIDGVTTEIQASQTWGWLLALIPVGMTLAILSFQFEGVSGGDFDNPAVVAILGLGLFGVVFAVNSSIHSYLILFFSGSDKVAADVGFYYMANAGGRLIGTLFSGYLYQTGGVTLCLIGSAVMIALSAGIMGILSSVRE